MSGMPKHCPVGGAGARMTRGAFAKVCRWQQSQASINQAITSIIKPFCLECKIGEDVAAGLSFDAPPRIEFIDLQTLQMEKIMQSEKNGEKTVPQGNWKEMSYEDAAKLQPADLLKVWSHPRIISGKKGTCPNCLRPNLAQSCFGICGACRNAIKKGMHGIEMLAALAVKGAEKHAAWLKMNEDCLAEQEKHHESGVAVMVDLGNMDAVLVKDFDMAADVQESPMQQGKEIFDRPLPIKGEQEDELLQTISETMEEIGHACFDYTALAGEIGRLVESKQAAYGDSFGKAGDIMRILYPAGIGPGQIDDALCIVRIIDKLFRIATDKDALGESPYRDIAGYGLLGAARSETVNDFGVEDYD